MTVGEASQAEVTVLQHKHRSGVHSICWKTVMWEERHLPMLGLSQPHLNLASDVHQQHVCWGTLYQPWRDDSSMNQIVLGVELWSERGH